MVPSRKPLYARRFASQVLAALAALLALAMTLDVTASSSGITGRTNRDGGAGCGSCHSPSQTLGVAFAGSSSLTPGQTATYSINISGGTSGTNIGIDVAATFAGSAADVLSEGAANLQKIGNEITHTGTLNTANASGNGGYSFSVTMPVSAVFGQSVILYGASRNSGEWNHAANYTISMARFNQAALTALIGGAAAPAASNVGLTGALSTSGGSGGGAVSYASQTPSVCSVSGTTVTYIAIGTCTVRATKAADPTYNSTFDDVSLTIAKGSQTITFGALPNKLISDAPFVVAATASSGLAVTFGASGVCTSGGTNGATITLTGAVGMCSVTASQVGDANWFAASPVMQAFSVADPSAEVFPPGCQSLPGWTIPANAGGFADPGWSVATDDKTEGSCSLKSNPIPDTATAMQPASSRLAFTGNFAAGNITMTRRVSSEGNYDCFRVLIDGVQQNVNGACSGLGGYLGGITTIGASGEVPFGPISIPITGGTHTVVLSYDKDYGCCHGGSDAVWVDQLNMPLTEAITSSNSLSGTVAQFFSHQVLATNFPAYYGATGLPAGLSINTSTGLISGTPTAAGTFVAMITAGNPGGVNPSATFTLAVTISIARATQTISFPPINNKATFSPAFIISATGGTSGNPVTFTASGPCTAGGVNGESITTNNPGTCMITANQAGNANYFDAAPVTQSFQVSTFAAEIFPPNCVLPSGWVMTAGATASWAREYNVASSEGACSLRSGVITHNQIASVEVQNVTVGTGNVTFKAKTASEGYYDCLFFYINGVKQALGGAGSCALGGTGLSGATGFTSFSVPVSAGTYTFRWSYEKDGSVSTVDDAAWIDEVVFPQYTLTVTKAGGGNGTVFSSPAGIVCPGTCSAALSGNVLLTAVPATGSYISSWSVGACGSNSTCQISLPAITSVTATFALITAPTAPQMVSSIPGNGQATLSFTAPASNGGAPITSYTSTCVASGQTTRMDSASNSPIIATGLANGIEYSCTVTATNYNGSMFLTGMASAATLVTPRTVPDAPLIGMGTPGNGTATISFSAPGFNGGSNITSYTATCTAAGQTTRQASAATVTPITVSSLVNGVAYSCTVAAANVAGTGSASGAVSVTPRTAPGAPTMISSTPLDARVTLDWQPPSSDGGSPVTGYNLSCNGGSLTVNGISPPATVSGLTNGLTYTCTIAAVNAAGSTASSSFSFTPAVQAGSSYWSSICTNCHAMTPDQPQTNAAGTTPAVLNYAIANQPLMSMNGSVTALTQAERTAIAGYLASVRPAASASTAFNTPVVVDLAPQLILGTVSFETMEIATPPASGNLTMLSGTQVTFTPSAGFVGMMTFSVRGARAMPSVLQGDPILVTVTVAPPPVPVVNSPASASGTNGVPFSYQITATNAPTGYNATGLPSGLTVNMGNGLISGTPTVGGGFMVTLTATNQGGPSLPATLNLTLNPASQTITFGAQTTASRPYVYNGTFALAPAASASSGLAVTYVSKTPSVCSVGMGTTINILAAGTCTIGANQGGNASFAVATEVTQSVTITPSTPAAPVIGTASPGNNQAVVAFTPSADTGGVPIILYTATCTASGQTTRTGTNSTSPILVTGLTNLVQYSCSVTATNSATPPTSLPSASANVTPDQTPTPPSIVSANSATFTVNAPGSFSVVATGYPATFTFGQSGTLPTGISFSTMSGVLSGTPTQAGSFPITFSVSNGSLPNASQNFTLTVNKGNQSISFANPGSVAVSAGPIPLSAAATSGLAVSFVSDTTGVCTIMGSNAILIGTGTCTIRAQQAGNANFNPATDVPQSFTVTQGTQSITFGAQVPASRAFGVMPFMLSPTATSSSMLAVTYTSLTTSVCTITGSTVTVGAAGTCTIAANQGGNASYAPAAQVTQSVTITGTAPCAPTLNTATGGDQKITLAFTAPASNGGSPITGYTANCGGTTAGGTSSPIAVTGLTNGMSYSCSVTASNGTTGAASNSLMATPNLLPGKTVWDANCNSGGCHLGTPNLFRLNVGGTNATALNYAVAHPGGLMPGLMITVVNSLTAQQKSDLVAYIADFIPPVTASTPVNTPVDISVASQVFLNTNTLAFTGLQQVSAPANGALSFPGGTTITYTPAPGFTGTDTFAYRAFQAGVQTEPRTVSVTVTPAAPVITSSLTASATINQAFNYQIAASNGPTSYGASGLPGGLNVNMMTGVISGTPVASGNSMVTISANGPGGTGMATLSLTVNLASQTITFGAQSTPRTYSQGGTFPVSPLAMGGGSGNAVTYSSTTTGVCTVSGTTVTMVSAGICTIAANQLGNATYAAAPQVTQGVTINGTAPAVPTGIGGVAGNMQATVNFTAPTNTGGLPITGYTVNCSGIVANGGASPITVFGLTNGTTYTCYVQATNLVGPSAQSSTVMITPVAIAFTGNVFSRKLHGGVAYNLPVADNPIANATIEPRGNSGGHQIVFVFSAPVSSATVTLTDAMGAPVGGGVTATPSYSGNELLVNIGNLPDASRVNVNATMVNGALSVTRPVAFLVGDVTQTGRVGAADIAAIKSRGSANLATGLNFLFDISLNGSINAVDVSQAKARAGQLLP